MPLSQISIPVSHLPTSCSFYLSTLAPLGYRCLGQQGNDIAFGIQEVEFFLHQQHSAVVKDPVKFVVTARSRSSVFEFWHAGLLAGGQGRAPPCEGEDESWYCRATVSDFDGNHIGAMYRPDRTESRLQRPRTASGGVVVHTIPANPAVEVHRIRPEPPDGGEISTRAILGTLLGASAGAAAAYAMAKSEDRRTGQPNAPKASYRTMQTPSHRITEVYSSSEVPPNSYRGPIQMIDREGDEKSTKASSQSTTRAKSHGSPKSRSSTVHASNHSSTSQTSRSNVPKSATRLLIGPPDPNPSSAPSKSHSKRSRAATATPLSTNAKSVQSSKHRSSKHSSSGRSAKDVALPPSRASTNLTPATNPGSSKSRGRLNDLGTVVPGDSISQVSTQYSASAGRKSTGHHGHSSHRSSRTIRA